MPLAIRPGMASAAKRFASPRGRKPSGVAFSGPIQTAHADQRELAQARAAQSRRDDQPGRDVAVAAQCSANTTASATSITTLNITAASAAAGIAVIGVEHTHQHRDGPGQHQIGQHQPRQFDRSVMRCGRSAKPGASSQHQQRHRECEQDATSADQRERRRADQPCRQKRRRPLRRLRRADADRAAPKPHSARLRSAAAGSDWRTGTPPRRRRRAAPAPNSAGDRHVAHEAEHARGERRCADNGDIPGNRHWDAGPTSFDSA